MFPDIMVQLHLTTSMIGLFMLVLVMFMIYIFRNLIKQLPNYSTLSGALILANCSGKLYGLGRARYEKMLGLFPDLFHAFCNAGIRTRLDIMYIILQHISMFLIQEIGHEACYWVRYFPESCLP